MNKREAIEFCEKSLSEIIYLAKLPYDNYEYPLWYKTIEGILEGVFGRDSSEYQNFSEARSYVHLPGHQQEEYRDELKMRETALLSIINKHEILGFETEPATKTEPPDALEDYEEKATSKKLELILDGTPDMIIECIMNFVKKLNSQGYAYKSIPRIGGAPDFVRWDKTHSARCAIFETHEGGDEQIGTMRLTLLPKEQTLLSVPEPKDWKSSFGVFLSYLLGEFKRLGFVHFEEEKPPMGFKLPHKEKSG